MNVGAGGRCAVHSVGVETGSPTCALCGKAIGGAETAHAVGDRTVCEACRRRVSALEPRAVLPYADRPVRRGRRWVWPALAAAAVVVALLVTLLWTVQRAAMERARAEEMRALAAQQRARAAAEAVRARMAETQPAE